MGKHCGDGFGNPPSPRHPRTPTRAAWTASPSKQTYLSAQYRRLAGRRGKKRAIVALGHTMLVMMYHMLRGGVDYRELGPDYLDKLQCHRLTHYLVKRLEALGHEVTLTPFDRGVGIFRAVAHGPLAHPKSMKIIDLQPIGTSGVSGIFKAVNGASAWEMVHFPPVRT